ncbi:unnamed protein product [Peniophora sp. CBMAI 1063]|nr:unnamed protein product [Peniophora sp. CBMAI 1063]
MSSTTVPTLPYVPRVAQYAGWRRLPLRMRVQGQALLSADSTPPTTPLSAGERSDRASERQHARAPAPLVSVHPRPLDEEGEAYLLLNLHRRPGELQPKAEESPGQVSPQQQQQPSTSAALTSTAMPKPLDKGKAKAAPEPTRAPAHDILRQRLEERLARETEQEMRIPLAPFSTVCAVKIENAPASASTSSADLKRVPELSGNAAQDVKAQREVVKEVERALEEFDEQVRAASPVRGSPASQPQELEPEKEEKVKEVEDKVETRKNEEGKEETTTVLGNIEAEAQEVPIIAVKTPAETPAPSPAAEAVNLSVPESSLTLSTPRILLRTPRLLPRPQPDTVPTSAADDAAIPAEEPASIETAAPAPVVLPEEPLTVEAQPVAVEEST